MNSSLEVSTKPSLVIVALIVLVAFGTVQAQENERDRRDQQRTRQAQAVSQHVYDKIQQAQELAETENYDTALGLLSSLRDKDNLTDYERSNVLQHMGSIQFSTGDTLGAISTFSDLLSIPGLEEQIRQRIVYTQAQLNSAAERYADAIRLYEEWFELEPNPAPAPFIQYAKTLYQVDRYSEMIEPIESALQIAKKREIPVKEDWYVLLSFAYFRQENYREVRDIQKILLVNWPKKSYWLSLAGAYVELGEDDNLFATYDAIHMQGLFEKENEFLTMAQLYMQHDVPYKAGTLLEMEMDKGNVARNAKNYRLLSQAWSLALEDERSVPALKEAARLSEGGELDLRLANAYLNLGQYAECAGAVRGGLKKGAIKSPDNAWVTLGMCLYNQQKYREAISSFREAGKTRRSSRISDQWIAAIDIDIKRDEQIAYAETALREKLAQLMRREEIM